MAWHCCKTSIPGRGNALLIDLKARLADRRDAIMLHQVLARAEIALMTCLCGLNALYLPHPDFK